MEKQRGFEVISEWQGKNINLPERKTACSAGYDLEAAKTVVIEPNQVVFVPTGLKAYMQPDEVLHIHIRSSLGCKRNLMLANNVGVVDADYYDNEANEGHILLALWNYGTEAVTLNKGERLAQGVFVKYQVADGDAIGVGAKRAGGFGSTGAK